MSLWVVTSPACVRAGWRWAGVGGGLEVDLLSPWEWGPVLHDSRGRMEACLHLEHLLTYIVHKRHIHTILSAAIANMQHLTRERGVYSQQCPTTNNILKIHRLHAVAALYHVICQIN